MASIGPKLNEVWEVRGDGDTATLAPTIIPEWPETPNSWDLSGSPSYKWGGSETANQEPGYWYDNPQSDYDTNRGVQLQSPFLNVSQNVQHGGTVAGGNGFNSEQQPYSIISTPRMDIDKDTYGHYFGYPSNITTELGTLRGFTKVDNIHLENIGCTSLEERELFTQLHNGVIIRSFADTRPSIFTLYRNNSDPNVIGKELTTLRSFQTIRLKHATSIVSPTFLLSGIDDIAARINYVYYPDFDRYYFVNNIVSVRDDLWAINCSADPLETFKTKLASLPAHIERQEYNYNLYLNDSQLRADSRPIIRTLKFPHNFDDDPFTFIVIGYGRHGEEWNNAE